MAKHELLKTFMKDHTQAYALVAGPRRVVKRRPGFVVLREQDLEQASLHQKNHACKYNLNQKARTQVQFESESIRRSPIDVATELIAKSGVWRSQEQYLATLFMLQPIQNLWLAAWENDSLADLQSTLTLSRLIKDMDVCRLFLHGPGGSGKMYSITEVVTKVVKFFFGDKGVLAVAPTRNAARSSGGITMHASALLGPNFEAKKARFLGLDARAKKVLQHQWDSIVMMLGHKIHMATPPLLAAVSHRAAQGRVECYSRRDIPFGGVLVQVPLLVCRSFIIKMCINLP